MRECQKRAKANYQKKVETVRFELYPTDTDIKDRLAEVIDKGETKAGYLKRLIRADIQKRDRS